MTTATMAHILMGQIEDDAFRAAVAIAASRPIEAIRLMRARTGCTLAYAKEALDRYRGLR